MKISINKFKSAVDNFIKKKKGDDDSIMALFDIVYLKREDMIYLKNENMYMDIIEKKTKDLNNIDSSEEEFDILKEAMLHKMVKELKIVFLNFQNSATEQLEFYKKLLENTDDIVRKKWLSRSINELSHIEKTTEKKGYYYFIFDKDKKELAEKRKNIFEIMQTGIDGRVRELTCIEKEKVLEKAFNLNEKLYI